MKSREFETAEIAKFTKEEYDNYEESLKAYRDWKNTIHTAEYNKAVEIARKMKAKGVAIDIIAECSGLTEEQINAL